MSQDTTTSESTGFPDKGDSFREGDNYTVTGTSKGQVQLIPGREGVYPDKPEKSGRTPLLYATKDGHTGVVEILLRRGEVDPDRSDNFGQTPLSSAARNGHEKWWKYWLGEKMSTPTSRIGTAAHLSRMLLVMDGRNQWEYFSTGKMLTLTSQISAAEYRSRTLLMADVKHW